MRGKLTRRITVFYYQSMWVRISRFWKFKFDPVLSSLTEAHKRAFSAAAHQCSRLDATCVDYVASQFDVFDSLSDSKGRLILPLPAHLHGESAERRYLKRNDGWKHRRSEADLIANTKRTVPGSDGNVFDVEAIHGQFFRDERKLFSLAKLLKLPPETVLRQRRADFSPEFLSLRTAVTA